MVFHLPENLHREHESPNDPKAERNGPDDLARLDEIERRLKAVRPRPPRLDVAALERRARDTLADSGKEKPTPRVGLSQSRGYARPLARRVALVAGSAACGAVAGALVMFLFMSRTGAETDGMSETARTERQSTTSPMQEQMAVPVDNEEVDRMFYRRHSLLR